MTKTVNVRIFGRDEVISCEENEVDDLVQAAALLDAEMSKTKKSVKQTMPFDRLCMLASLNLVHRLLQSERQVNGLSQKLNSLLGLRKQLAQTLQGSASPTDKPGEDKLF